MERATPARGFRPWRLLRRLGTVVALCYLGIILCLMALETELVYHPSPASASWREPMSVTVRDVELTTAEGQRLHAWWCPAEGATGAVLYCHGNSNNLSNWAGHIEMIRQELGESVLIFDYPGFGKSAGSPSEAACYAAADAAYDWLLRQARVPPERVVIYGLSLGGGPAVDLASRRPHRALLLASTFTALPEVGQAAYPWLPVRWVMRNRFDNLGKIGQCGGPVVITHGTADRLFPFAHAEALFAAAAEPKLLLPVLGVGHVDPGAEFFRQARRFLERVEGQPRPSSPGK